MARNLLAGALIQIKADQELRVIYTFGGREAMPITDAIILSVIVFAFLAFAVVLAWGDYQTREIARKSRDRALFGSDAHVVQSVEAETTEQVADNNNASQMSRERPDDLAAVCTEMVRKGTDFPIIWRTLLKGHILVDGIPESRFERNRPVLIVRLITGERLVFDGERRKFSMK